jgi:hypothetical protein
MLRLIMRMSCFLAFLLAVASLQAQTEFSADMIDTGRPGTPTQAKLYFAKDKLRIEPQEHNAAAMGVAIVNFSTQSSIVLILQQHMYLEMPAQMGENRGMFSFFKSGDAENACPDWLNLAANKGGTCHKVGSETVNGRSTVKYEGTNSKGDRGAVWLDSRLRFPVKWEDKNGSGEMRNIQEGSQPASLFEVPAGFTKMDMGGMMQQMQRQH